MTPREYSFATPADLGGQGNYRRFCRVAGLRPISVGWGLLHCVDEDGRHLTAVTSDVPYLRMLVEADLVIPELLADLVIPAEKFPLVRAGWPDEWVTGSGS